MSTEKQKALKELRRIPGVGKSIAEDLWNIGGLSRADLKDANAEELYKHCAISKKLRQSRQ